MNRLFCRRYYFHSSSGQSMDLVNAKLMKKKVASSNLDFIYIWEVERRMKPFGKLSWDVLNEQMIDSWVSLTNKEDILSQIERDLQDSELCGPPALKKGEVYSFSASVDSGGRFTPRGPIVSHSNRMFRVYGPHRFLRVKYDNPLPKRLRLNALSFAGRRWELLYAELSKGVVVYFAVKGSGISKEVSIERLREWHIPMFEQDGSETSNSSMTLSKYNARFALGFSGSIGTVVFDNVKKVEDVSSEEGHVMTDGCAAMPLWAMQQIANAGQLSVLPSVVQGRIGG
jgi:RNA dependent RNA polymerase